MNYRFDNCFMASTKDHICWKKRDLYLVLFSSNICCLNRFGRLAAMCLITCNRKFHHFTEGGEGKIKIGVQVRACLYQVDRSECLKCHNKIYWTY